MVKDNNDISVKEVIEELMQTSIFQKIAKRNSKNFAQKLAIWLVRYILVISSMNESLKISLETVLLNLHGEKLWKVLEVTEKTFQTVKHDSERYNKYIW